MHVTARPSIPDRLLRELGKVVEYGEALEEGEVVGEDHIITVVMDTGILMAMVTGLTMVDITILISRDMAIRTRTKPLQASLPVTGTRGAHLVIISTERVVCVYHEVSPILNPPFLRLDAHLQHQAASSVNKLTWIRVPVSALCISSSSPGSLPSLKYLDALRRRKKIVQVVVIVVEDQKAQRRAKAGQVEM